MLVLCLVAQTATPVFSQKLQSSEPPPIDYETAHLSRVVSAVRITEEISFDGRLDEPVWSRALPATDFRSAWAGWTRSIGRVLNRP